MGLLLERWAQVKGGMGQVVLLVTLAVRAPLLFIVEDLHGVDPVWSKNSCGFTLVVFQEPPEPFATLNRACTLVVSAHRRKEHDVAFPLVWTFFMLTGDVLVERMPQGLLSK